MHTCLRLGQFALVVTSAALAASCYYGTGPYVGSRGGVGSSTTTTAEGSITAQHIEGDLGTVTNITSDAVEAQGTASGVQFDAVGDNWWVMTRLNFSPALSDPQWAPGMTLTTENLTVGAASGPRVSAMGCSGPSRGHYIYDGGANRVTVHVEQGSTPGSRQVSYTVYWDNASGHPSALSGSFEYEPN